MSAQPSAQISGNSPAPSILQRLRGSLSNTSQQMLSQGMPQDPVQTPNQDQPEEVPQVPEEPILKTPAPELVDLPVEEQKEEDAATVAEQVQQLEEQIQQEVVAEQAPQPSTELDSSEELPPVEREGGVAQEEQLEPISLETIASSVPLAVDSLNTLNPPSPVGGSAKEAPLLNVTVERPAVDQVPGVQYVETEKSHELPPEVEGFLKKVEDNVDQIPNEIVISDPQTGQALPRVMAQPVVVLPITARIEEEGKKKNESYGVRWLVEWSWKVMKIFSGRVVYRQERQE